MPHRIRPHKKSRTGCKTCRRRRVKCDETHPVCKNCIQRDVECVWAELPPPPPPPTSSAITTIATQTTLRPFSGHGVGRAEIHWVRSKLSSPASAAWPTTSPISAPPPPYETTAFLSLFSLSLPPPVEPPLDMKSLMLLHYYSLETYATIPGCTSAYETWKTTVPKIAMSSPNVLHAIMAVTALHKSVVGDLSPAARAEYSMLAGMHYQKASVGLRTELLTQNSVRMTEHLGNSLFLTSALINVYAIGSSASTSNQQRHEFPSFFMWIPLIRGIRTVLRSCMESIKNGALAPLFILQPRSKNIALISFRSNTGDLPDYLDTIHIPNASPWPSADEEGSSRELRDPTVAVVYKDVVAHLRFTWQIAVAGGMRTFSWPMATPELYIRLLMEKRPRALVILAHYFVFLATMGDVWWVRSRAKDELLVVMKLLDPTWHRWLEWPKKHVLGRTQSRISSASDSGTDI